MWKNILALSALILSISMLLRSVPFAEARTGTLSLGFNTAYSISDFTTGTAETLSAVSGQDRIISDVYLSAQPGHELEAIFTTTSGQEIGRFKVWNHYSYSNGAIHNTFESGLRVPAGEDVTITINGRGVYTISGFLAQP